MKNTVLQALADKIQAHFRDNPEAAKMAADQAKQLQSICNMFLVPQVRKAIDRINLTSGINNLN